jgi:hypothetical protein
MSSDRPWIQDRLSHPLNEYHFEYLGYKCSIKNTTHSKNWNGYVSISNQHPYYDKHYSDIEEDISVYGGLTYSNTDSKNKETTFGFDTVHYDDIVLDQYNNPIFHISSQATYKTYEFVEQEIHKLVKQFKEAACEDDQKSNFD